MNGGIAVPTRSGRRASQNLTRVGLTLAPQRSSWRRVLGLSLLAITAFAAGLGVDGPSGEPVPMVALRTPPVPSADLIQLQGQLDQARMAARVSLARTEELERHIDALTQKVSLAQGELNFIRKARDAKKPN